MAGSERPDAPAQDGSGPTDASVDDGAEAESSAPVDTTADESEAGDDGIDVEAGGTEAVSTDAGDERVGVDVNVDADVDVDVDVTLAGVEGEPVDAPVAAGDAGVDLDRDVAQPLLVFDLNGSVEPGAPDETVAVVDTSTLDTEAPVGAEEAPETAPPSTLVDGSSTGQTRPEVAALVDTDPDDAPASPPTAAVVADEAVTPTAEVAESVAVPTPATQVGTTPAPEVATVDGAISAGPHPGPEPDALLELHDDPAEPARIAPTTPRATSTAEASSASADAGVEEPISVEGEALDGTGEPAAAGATGPAEATTTANEAGPLAPQRPVTPTRVVPPIGSSQATVEAVASSQGEQPISVAEAQQTMAAMGGDGIDAPEVWRQVQRAVGSLRTNLDGDQQMTIRLRPAELGSVMVRVIANETGTNISVVAETSAAANQLSQQRQQLASELENSGLRGVSVDIGAQTGEGHRSGDTDGDDDGGTVSTPDRSARRLLADPGAPQRARPGTDRARLIDLDL
ncbi:MAG: flagellar hook-length control protein FliK [Actinomycetota bacterium]